MNLVTVDPKSLTPNPDNPRRSNAGSLPDDQLVASIKAIGILQPPVVRKGDGGLVIIAGHRRVRAAIAAGIEEIVVLAREADDGADNLRALSENVVRASLNPVDQWRAIEALNSDHWTEEAIATALALPVRTIKKLRLLAHLHPPMLDVIAQGDMPQERELRVISAAGLEEQASVWKTHKPKKGQASVAWYAIANGLSKRRMLACNASFGPEEEKAFGILWEEDLFAPADEDSRYTTNAEAFLAAQEAWLDAHLPKKAVILATNEYGEPKLPPKAERLWRKPGKGDFIGQYIDPRSGQIQEVAYRLPQADPKEKSGTTAADDGDLSAPVKKTRPEITQKGADMIGEFRTEALAKALIENPIEDSDLLGLLIVAFTALNVDVRLGDYQLQHKRKALVAQIAEGGRLTKDIALLRTAAREMLATILSCRRNYHASGNAARIAGDTIGADAHLPNMATDEFLSCCSKTALETIAASLGLPPEPRAKETRAAIVAASGNGHFVHPAARFALTDSEIATLQPSPLTSLDDEADDWPSDAEGDDSPAAAADGRTSLMEDEDEDAFDDDDHRYSDDEDDDPREDLSALHLSA